MNIVKLDDSYKDKLNIFCNKCENLGWVNNSSIDNMRWNKVYRTGGAFLAGVVDDTIISVAGYCPLLEIDGNAWRVFYRSATLPKQGPNKGLHRGTGPRGRMYIDQFIEILPNSELYITTNIENKSYKHILRYHRHLELESQMKDSYISKLCETVIDNTNQAVWKLDVEKYLARTK